MLHLTRDEVRWAEHSRPRIKPGVKPLSGDVLPVLWATRQALHSVGGSPGPRLERRLQAGHTVWVLDFTLNVTGSGWKALKTKFFHESFGCNPDWQMRGFSVLLQKVTPLKMGCSPSASLTCYVIYGMCTVSSFYFCVFLKYSYFYKYFLLISIYHGTRWIIIEWC